MYMYVCFRYGWVHVCVCVCVAVWAHVHVGVRGQPQVLSPGTPPLPWDKVSHQAREPGQWARDASVSTLCYHAWHFTWVLGIKLRPVWETTPLLTELIFIFIFGGFISGILSLTSLMACPLLIYRHRIHCALTLSPATMAKSLLAPMVSLWIL